ncbi:MAG: hypothetical protein KH056_09335, partial [Clostridiales bacterium]|nr:hypothetical protein [Clostridiales bacterium]
TITAEARNTERILLKCFILSSPLFLHNLKFFLHCKKRELDIKKAPKTGAIINISVERKTLLFLAEIPYFRNSKTQLPILFQTAAVFHGGCFVQQ